MLIVSCYFFMSFKVPGLKKKEKKKETFQQLSFIRFN